MMYSLHTLTLAAVAALALTAAPAARAEIVYDPTNYAQNLLQATRALEQIHNQIRQIELETQMLAKNPLQLSPELTASLDRARELFRTAEGLAFEVDRIGDDLKDLYPETWEAFDLADIGVRSRRWLAEDRATLERAARAEAVAVASIGAQQGRIDRALQASRDAEGATGATQAGNQLLGIGAAELAEIRALLVAQSRALTAERLARVAAEERAAEIRRRAFPTHSTPPAPARSAFER